MTLKEFAKTLDGREYGHEITKEEEILAKELGFVVVFGYSDDNAELRGAIYDEIGCYDGGILKHDDLPDEIYADWCPDDIDCAWAYGTSIPHETFYIYDNGELYCVGIVCDINKPKQTNADRIRAMGDEELAKECVRQFPMYLWPTEVRTIYFDFEKPNKNNAINAWIEWLKQPAEEERNG